MSSTLAPEEAAVDAAHAAFVIASGLASSEPIVLYTEHFDDVHHAVRAALAARAARAARLAIGTYRVVEIDAQYGIHGTFLDERASLGCDVDGNVDGHPGCDGRPTVVVITVKSKFKIGQLTQIPVIADLSRAIEGLTVPGDTCVVLELFIIEQLQG